MGMLDHWHPVYPCRQLTVKPVGVKLAGRMICLFRTSKGEASAIDDVCPHRRMKLSQGTVVGDRLQCKYHGWTFDACGNGESPSTPKLRTCTDAFDTHEAHGYVWIKSKASNPVFPELNPEKFYHIGTLSHVAAAPLELTLDNFNEIEHSGTVHDTFGYDLERLDEVQVRFETTEDTVRVVNVGPSKTINRFFRFALGIRKGDLFHDDWTTHFSPVYSVFNHWWTSPDGTRQSMIRWRVYVFFYPVDADNTAMVSFAYAKSYYPDLTGTGGLWFAKYLLRYLANREIEQDIAIVENLADKRVTIDGMKLNRFDRVLGMTRDRIATIYRGESVGRISVA